MPTKIRLQRKGKKGQPFYHIVSADGRAPRDGKFIERLGYYNPTTHPATIELNFERALYWVQVGAQPSDTARMILSKEGVLLKDHLIRGMKKGALTEEQVEEKFNAWKKEKAEQVEQALKESQLTEKEKQKKRIEEERKISEARAEELAKKHAAEMKKEEAERKAEEPEEEKAPEEESAPAEAAAEEKPAAEKP
ncbi:MAG: 30S ribosomal protein S16, partial [Bacteroidota bacterium]